MISEEQAREAAARLKSCVDATRNEDPNIRPEHVYGCETQDEAVVLCQEDILSVAGFFARGDSERAELDQPIDAEWLALIGFRAGHDLAWHSGRVSVRQYAQSVHDNTTSTILLDDNEIIWNATRRQLLRLIEALRGGA